MSKFLMKNGKVWGIVGDYGKDSEMNKDKVISEQYKERDWKIEYNEFGLETEAKAIQGDLATFTGLNKSNFPVSTGLSRPKELKVWFGQKLLWDYTQEERVPDVRELISQLGLIEERNWLIQKHI